MSVRKMAEVWELSQQSGSALLMLLAIADFSDDDGRAYPSVSALAVKCRMGARNANLLLANLRDSGELQIRVNAGPKGTNLYRIPPLKWISPLKPPSSMKPTSLPPEAGFPKPLNGTSDEPSVNHQGTTSTRSRPKSKSALPKDFVVSAEVASWAAKNGFDQLEEQLEVFKEKCAANGYLYVDHDSAFKAAIRNDWAGLRRAAGRGGKAPAQDGFAVRDYGKGGRL